MPLRPTFAFAWGPLHGCYKLLHSLQRSTVSVHSFAQPHTLPRIVRSFSFSSTDTVLVLRDVMDTVIEHGSSYTAGNVSVGLRMHELRGGMGCSEESIESSQALLETLVRKKIITAAHPIFRSWGTCPRTQYKETRCRINKDLLHMLREKGVGRGGETKAGWHPGHACACMQELWLATSHTHCQQIPSQRTSSRHKRSANHCVTVRRRGFQEQAHHVAALCVDKTGHGSMHGHTCSSCSGDVCRKSSTSPSGSCATSAPAKPL